MDIDLGSLYAAARSRITDLVMSSPPDVGDLEVPGTPGWTVHDVVGHLRGIVADGLAGNMAGAPGEAWTAAQIERARGLSVTTLLQEWGDQAPSFERFLSSPTGPMAQAAVMDVHVHECDLRGALDRPAPLVDEFGSWALPALLTSFVAKVQAAGLPAVRVETDLGDVVGDADAEVVLRASRHELFRALFGRRSPAQVAAFDWGDADPAPYLECLWIFGPRDAPLDD